MEQSLGQRVSFLIHGDESYDCSNVMNEVPLHHGEFQPADLYLSKFQISEIIQASQKRTQSTHTNRSHRVRQQNQFLDQESRIYQENEDKSNQPQNSSTELNEGSQQSSSKQSNKKVSKYVKKANKERKSKPNNCDSKNFFLFLWKKVIKVIKNQFSNQDEEKIIKSLQQQSGSIESFNYLFSCQLLKEDTERMFRQKYFNRCVMISSIDACTKKRYLDFVRRVEKSYYTKKRIEFLR